MFVFNFVYICPMQKQSVKERIIETASRLFYFEGYNQTGINQIIEEAGVAKSSMYQSFRSKEEIAVEYLQRRHKMWIGNLSDFVSDKKSGNEKIIGALAYIKDWLEGVEYRGCGFQNIVTDLPKGQNSIADQVLFHKNELLDWLRQELKEENYNTEETDILAKEIMVIMEGAIILAQIQKNSWPVNSAESTLRKLLV